MPNAKRVLQDREAAAKRYATYGEQIAAYNANVDQVNAANQSASDLYNQQAAAYNAWMDQIKAGQSTGLAKTDDGRYAQLGSHNGDFAYSYRDERGNPYDAAPLLGSRAELDAQSPGQMTPIFGAEYGPQSQWQGNSYWVKNADGTATRYTGTGSTVKVSPEDPKYTQPLVDYGENHWQPAWLLPDGTVTTSDPNVRQETGWRAEGETLRIAEFSTPAPTTQQVSVPTPEEPKGWNPSLRELAELQMPTADAAGSQMATARGEAAKTGLMNEAAGRDSAFADPEDPTNLADKGILARVLGGQL